MVSISDSDVQRIDRLIVLAKRVQGNDYLRNEMHDTALDIRSSIRFLMQPAPYQPPRIVEIPEAEMRRIYPERFK